MKNNNLYEQDFSEWALHNAELLRAGKLHEIDIANIAEELESLGKQDKRALMSRAILLLMHLLKWQFQAERRSTSWELTLKEQRKQILRLCKDSPSLKKWLSEQSLEDIYLDALEDAIDETGLDEKIFPKNCPYSLEQILDKAYYPE